MKITLRDYMRARLSPDNGEPCRTEGVHAFVHGRLPAVIFRDFVRHNAQSLALTGFVRDLPDGETVEVVAEGERRKLEDFLRHLERAPKGSQVELVEYEWRPAHHQFQGFRIVRS